MADAKTDLYNTYPGFEILLEGPGSDALRNYERSRVRSPFAAYEMIGAVFGDLTAPLKEEIKKEGQPGMDRTLIRRYEAAGALALSAEAEAFTESSDKDAKELARLAADADADQSAHLSARALALIAVQNSHVIRLLSRRVRVDGIRDAILWGETVQAANDSDRTFKSTVEFLPTASRTPSMARFGSLF